jgi:hypothetical protein
MVSGFLSPDVKIHCQGIIKPHSGLTGLIGFYIVSEPASEISNRLSSALQPRAFIMT